MKIKLDHIAQDGRPVYVANQPSERVFAKTMKRIIDQKLLEAAKKRVGESK